MGFKKDRFNFTLVNLKSIHNDDTFILASQVAQVFYVLIMKEQAGI